MRRRAGDIVSGSLELRCFGPDFTTTLTLILILTLLVGRVRRVSGGEPSDEAISFRTRRNSETEPEAESSDSFLRREKKRIKALALAEKERMESTAQRSAVKRGADNHPSVDKYSGSPLLDTSSRFVVLCSQTV